MATRANPQTSMDETRIDDSPLLKLLEKREEAKEGAAEFRRCHKEAMSHIRGLEANYPIRVGRFVITQRMVEGKEVSFETSDSMRFGIKVDGSSSTESSK